MARVLAWYSHGVASAVALKMAINKYGDSVVPVNCNTHSEHPDNARFQSDVEKWLGVKVTTLMSATYLDVDDVIANKRFLRGPNGAPCTTELKKVPRLKFQLPDDKHIFGYTYDEGKRIANLMAENWDLRIECPLYSAKMTKQDCLQIVADAGIEIPIMYRLGFDNNNCPGCVKAESPNYWNLVRVTHPDVFQKRAEQERELGYALTRYRKKPIYLDELPVGLKTRAKEKLSCDFVCGGQSHDHP